MSYLMKTRKKKESINAMRSRSQSFNERKKRENKKNLMWRM